MSLLNIVVVFFLLSSIVCSHFSSYNEDNTASEVVLTRKTASPSSVFTQLFCEEKEKEEKNSSGPQKHFSSSYLVIKANPTSDVDVHAHFSHQARRSCGNATDVPLYLVKQTFLI